MTTTIEATGTSAQPIPRMRSIHAGRLTARGAATTAAWSRSRPASEGTNGRLTPAPCLALQPPLQGLELAAQLLGHAVTKAGEVLVDLRELGDEGLGVDLEELGHGLLAHLEALGVDPALADGRHEPDPGLDRLRPALAAPEHPGEDTRVLSEARPHELPVLVLAEPVDVEDARELGALTPPDAQPVREVVTHVVAAE